MSTALWFNRRYREERALPPRFLVQTSAQSNASLAPKSHHTQTTLAGAYIPKYQTSAQVSQESSIICSVILHYFIK